MAIIQTRTIEGVEDKAIVFGSRITASCDSIMSRKLSFGSNWNVVRIGILCAIDEYPSQSYDRACALVVGMSSGSNNPIKNPGQGTCFMQQLGSFGTIFGFSLYPFYTGSDDQSGSFFTVGNHAAGSWVNGTRTAANGTNSPGRGVYPNLGSGIIRKGIAIFEFSASAGGYVTSYEHFLSSSVKAQNSNRNITSSELISALTSSKYPPSASNVLMVRSNITETAFNRASYPLDTTFIAWQGVIPLEIYDWYIYKVN